MHTGAGSTNEANDLTSGYLERIEFLRNDGIYEQITLNESSVQEFLAFVAAASFSLGASLVLLDNGNIRAVWKLGGENRIGIQFRGDGNASFVIFKRPDAGGATSGEYGADTLDGVRARIRACGFEGKLRGRSSDTETQ